jgi:3-hydroxyacyl-CoA dehydrogenase
VTIDNPPVNAISHAVTAQLADAVAAFFADGEARALVVLCAGRTFVAGGDLSTFDDPGFSAGPFNAALARIEGSERPVVAALHGTALGGGLELALACHYRVCTPDTKLGFPEVLVGVLPGSLGTQRLPRLIPVAFALEMMLNGKSIAAQRALEAGLVDAIADGVSPAFGLGFAKDLVARSVGPRRSRAGRADGTGLAPDFFTVALAEVGRARPAYPAPPAIVRCVEAAVTQPFEAGEALEAELFDACRVSPQSRAMRHVFFAEREAARVPGLAADVATRPIARVGIVGAGTMGGGIAMNFANAGIETVLVEADAAALARGLATIRKNYEASAAKGRLRPDEAERRIGLLAGTLDDGALAGCELVIEAVYEDLALKKKVLERLGRVCKSGAIIASNTSTLDVDALATASGRPADVVGMHFFSPANVMRLLEVVRGARTAPDVLATVMKLAKRIGKVAAVSGVCYGFIGNRMAEPYMREAEFLLMEGATPAEIDGAVEDRRSIGLAMGPCRMLDMAGIDVGAKTVIEYGKAGGLPPDPSYRAMARKLYELGRHGQKTGLGYYRYESRTPVAAGETIETARTGRAARHRAPCRDRRRRDRRAVALSDGQRGGEDSGGRHRLPARRHRHHLGRRLRLSRPSRRAGLDGRRDRLGEDRHHARSLRRRARRPLRLLDGCADVASPRSFGRAPLGVAPGRMIEFSTAESVGLPRRSQLQPKAANR